MAVVNGPAWAEPGAAGLSVLNPLRVENPMFNLVDRFLPGVISTTPHARYLGLHGMVRAEAWAKGLDLEGSYDLLRRCEAVVAGITMYHDHHVALPEGHGQSRLAVLRDADGGIDVSAVAAKGAYSDAVAGFYGTYRGPEQVLGVVAPGPEQEPGDRYNDAAVRSGLGELLELAGQAHLSAEELEAAGHLCPCAAAGEEAAWLRSIVCGTAGGDAYAVADEARRDTARIVARILQEEGQVKDLQRSLRLRIGFGPPLDEGLLAGIDLAEGWRGAILRNYSIEAWRNIWWWLVRELREPQAAAAVGVAFAAQLPEDWTVADLTSGLAATVTGDNLIAVEDELRRDQPRPHPQTELRMLALGAQRLHDTDGRTRKVMAGDGEDDLGPTWVADELSRNASRPLRGWAAELAERLLWRSHRIALSKLDMSDPLNPRLPAQVIERDGLWSQQAAAGSGPVGLRLPSFTSMLAGCGVLGAKDGTTWLTDEGAVFVA